MTDLLAEEHPDLVDAAGHVWTWRGEGYAISSVVSPTDFRGRPWTTSAETVRGLFGTWDRAEKVPA